MRSEAVMGPRSALRWGWLGASAAVASVVGYAAQRGLAYVSNPAWIGEIEFYGLFAGLAFVALMAGAVAARPVPGRRTASSWGWIAASATILSVIGYVIQTILDYVDEPGIVGEIEFYGLFVGAAVVALVGGLIAVVTGRKCGDLTMRLGFIALGYVLLAQVIQSLWD